MKQILYFLAGAGLGAGLAWYLTKRHYESFLEDEIDSIRESYEEEKEFEDDKKIYRAKVRTLGYSEEQETPIVPIDEEDVNADGTLKDEVNPFPGEEAEHPYTIGPDAYHDEQLFDKATITYYTETDTLVTDEEEFIEPDLIGDALSKFGEYEEDTVFVRNEKMGMDFEIIRVNGAYEPN